MYPIEVDKACLSSYLLEGQAESKGNVAAATMNQLLTGFALVALEALENSPVSVDMQIRGKERKRARGARSEERGETTNGKKLR